MVAIAPRTIPIGSCSRDPIGYVDGRNLYQNYIWLSRTDPTGMQQLPLQGICSCELKEVDEIPKNAGGAVSCENGILVPKVKETSPEETKAKKCGFLDCNVEHEKDHIDFINKYCPKVCPKEPSAGLDFCQGNRTSRE